MPFVELCVVTRDPNTEAWVTFRNSFHTDAIRRLSPLSGHCADLRASGVLVGSASDVIRCVLTDEHGKMFLLADSVAGATTLCREAEGRASPDELAFAVKYRELMGEHDPLPISTLPLKRPLKKK